MYTSKIFLLIHYAKTLEYAILVLATEFCHHTYESNLNAKKVYYYVLLIIVWNSYKKNSCIIMYMEGIIGT